MFSSPAPYPCRDERLSYHNCDRTQGLRCSPCLFDPAPATRVRSCASCAALKRQQGNDSRLACRWKIVAEVKGLDWWRRRGPGSACENYEERK